MRVNVERLRAELEFITANPKQWDQAVWAEKSDCGTCCCIAGWAVLHEGIELSFRRGYSGLTADGRLIDEVAMEILGLDDDDADWLFSGGNTLYDLWSKASDLTNGAIQIPASLTEEAS